MSTDQPKKTVAEAVQRANAPPPKRKRFYTSAETAPHERGFAVLLDKRSLRTPGKHEVVLPRAELAQAVADEWAAQDSEIDPMTMPLTRLVNSGLDGVAGREEDVRADIVKYAGSDLLCYRAEHPAELVRRQAAAWDPVLAWAESALGAKFVLAAGIMPVTQSEAAIGAVARALEEFEALPLAALHVMTTLSGSALLALAHARGHLSLDDAWAAAHIDEDYQIEKWGADQEATDRRRGRQAAMASASRLLALWGR